MCYVDGTPSTERHSCLYIIFTQRHISIKNIHNGYFIASVIFVFDFLSSWFLSKILGKIHQSTTKVTLNEPPIIFNYELVNVQCNGFYKHKGFKNH